MMRKIVFFGLLMTFLFLPAAASYGDSLERSVSQIEDVNNIPDGTIVLISKQESDIPGYVHEKYAFVDRGCPGGVQIVDRHGAPISANDPTLRMTEQRMCAELRHEARDGD